ncbi:uncharacterized protein [Ptychodera flava]|uniref:uncharacterized protein n=1 Tax=Ptychodera flava TaxID=63121 RepID=UPI00396A6DB2
MRKTIGEIHGLAQKSALFDWDTDKEVVPSKRPHIEECHPYISAKNISDVIKLFQESPEGLEPIDRICLRHCFKVIEKYDIKTLSSAMISVFGTRIKVVFTAGTEHRFEITLDENYTPICRKISSIPEESEESKHKKIVRNCSQHISLKDIHDVILQLESSGIEIPEGDVRCLKYCYTFVEEKEAGVLSSAIIAVLGMTVTVIFKSGLEENKFEIILNDHGNPICHQPNKRDKTDEDDVGHHNLRRAQKPLYPSLAIVVDCHPCIGYKHIHGIIQNLESSEEELLDGDLRCLKYCYTIIKEQEKQDLENAKIIIYGICVTVVLKCGAEVNIFEITLTDKNEPTCRKMRRTIEEIRALAPESAQFQWDCYKGTSGKFMEFEKECIPKISFKDVHEVMGQLKAAAIGNDLICLQYCYNVLKSYPSEDFEDARLMVYGENIKVEFYSGEKSNLFEVTLNDKNDPVLNDNGLYYWKYEGKAVAVCQSKREIKKDCQPCISYEHIHDIIRQLETSKERLHDGDMRCLKYCYTMIKQHEKQDLENAKIIIYGISVTVVLKCGAEVNMFEITLTDKNEPTCRKIRRTIEEIRALTQETAQFQWNWYKETSGKFTTFEKKCIPKISYKDVHEVIGQLKAAAIGNDLRCLQYCYNVLKSYPSEDFEDACLMVYGEHIKVEFYSGEKSNLFEVTLDDKNDPVLNDNGLYYWKYEEKAVTICPSKEGKLSCYSAIIRDHDLSQTS